MGFRFSENEIIAQKNRSVGVKRPQQTLLNYNLKQNKSFKTNTIKSNSKTNFTHCKKCADKLTDYHSKVWGICPLCDMLQE